MAMADTVKTLVDNLGALSCTLTRTTQGAYDPTTSQFATGTTSTYTFNVVPEDFDQEMIDGDAIRTGDLMIHISPADITAITPRQADQITLYSQEWLVLSVNRINFKGADALWSLHVRRA